MYAPTAAWWMRQASWYALADDGGTLGISGRVKDGTTMLNAKKLRMLREACGWTPTEMLDHLAKEQNTYCSQTSLSAYELGRYSPKTKMMFALAKLYSVSVEELLI